MSIISISKKDLSECVAQEYAYLQLCATHSNQLKEIEKANRISELEIIINLLKLDISDIQKKAEFYKECMTTEMSMDSYRRYRKKKYIKESKK